MVATRRRSLTLFLLLAIFLMAQSLALAHATTHELHTDTDHCSICLRAGQYKAIAVDTGTAPTPVLSAICHDPLTPPSHPADRPLDSRARAPPSLTMR